MAHAIGKEGLCNWADRVGTDLEDFRVTRTVADEKPIIHARFKLSQEIIVPGNNGHTAAFLHKGAE